MASKVTSTSNLPWNWVIEALSSSNQVHTSLLIDLVKSAPEVSDDLEKNVREMVNLRILEGLSVKGNQINNNDTPAQGQKFELDPSNSSEDVLRHIMEEMCATDSRTVGPEVLNWDVQSFIMHKRTSFPMRALQKIKEAILEGSHSVLASLKEKSGLAIRTQCDDNTSVNLGNANDVALRLEENGRVAEVSMPNGNSSFSTCQNRDEELNEDLPERNLLRDKSYKSATSGEMLVILAHEDQIKLDDVCAQHVEATKKFKQDSNLTGDTLDEDLMALPLHVQSTNAFEGRFNLRNGVEIGSSIPQNRDDELEENFPDINLLPAKRKRASGIAENLERQISESEVTWSDGYDSQAKASKKFKRDADINGQNIVENPIASPLHGQSTNASEGIIQCSEREAHNLQIEVEAGSSTPQNRDDELQENFLDGDLLPSKRNRAAATTENLESRTYGGKITLGDRCGTHAEAAKKFKQDAAVTGDNDVENPMASPIHGIVTISSDRIIEDIDSGKCNLGKEALVGGMECNGSPHSDSQNAALKRLVQSCDTVQHGHLLHPLEVQINDSKVAEISTELHGQKNGVDESNGCSGGFEFRTSNNSSSFGMENCSENATYGFEGNFQKSTSGGGKAKDDMAHNPDLEMTSDSDEYDDERMNIALKKDALLSSQCTNSQDSYATQQNYCIKCNRDGQLLVCSSNTCQLLIHESCLHSGAKFDETGKFYCPFCAYSRAISEYLQVKRKASLARKDLATFIGVKPKCRPKKVRLRSDGAKQSHSRKNGEFGVDNEENIDEEVVNKVSKFHCLDNLENRDQAGPPISCSGDNPVCGEKVGLTDGTAHISAKGNLEREDIGPKCKSPGGNLEQQRASESVHESDNDCRKPNLRFRNEKNRELRGKKVPGILKSTLSHETSSGEMTESSEEDNEKPPTSNYHKRLQKPARQSTGLAAPQWRRKACPWSKEEEEKLKEGVQRICSLDDQKTPWKKILEFGKNVFEKGRTPTDLKDKWRNMCKASTASK